MSFSNHNHDHQDLRVCHMIDSLNWGGAQKLLVQLVSCLQNRGVFNAVVNLDSDPGSGSQKPAPFTSQLEDMSVEVNAYNAARLSNISRIINLVKTIKRGEFDLIHTSLQYANILGTAAGRLAGVPVICTIHSTGVDAHHYHPQRERLENLCLRFGAARVIAIGPAVAEANRSRLDNRPVDIIPNAVTVLPGISSHHRRKIRMDLMGDPERPLVISVGRLASPKGYDDLIDQFAAVHHERPDAFLVIVGEGSLHAELNTRINTLHLQNDILLTGARDDVPDLLRAADLYVCSSQREGLSVALLEAMAAALPVISTSVGDNSQLLETNPGQLPVGILVTPGQPGALKNAILSLLDDPAEAARMGVAARQRVINRYNVAQWCDQIVKLYAAVALPPVNRTNRKAG